METHNTTREAECEHLEVAGNCWQNINQELDPHVLSDSVLSEQKKLRHVLDWARRFLSSRSDGCHEFCRGDSLIMAFEKGREKRATCGYEIFDGQSAGKDWEFKCKYKPSSQDILHIPLAFTPGRYGEICPENRDYADVISETAGAQSEREMSQNQLRTEDGPMAKTSNDGYPCHLTIPSRLTVYEQYKHCVDQLHHLRMRQNSLIEAGCLIGSPEDGRETSGESAAPIEATIQSTAGPSLKESRPWCQKNTVDGNKRDCPEKTADAIATLGKVIESHVGRTRPAPDNVPDVMEGAALTNNAANKGGTSPRPEDSSRRRQRTEEENRESWSTGAPGKITQFPRFAHDCRNNDKTSSSVLSRPQSAGAVKYPKRRAAEERVKRPSPHRDKHACQQPTETRTLYHDDTRPTSTASGSTVKVDGNVADGEHGPAALWLRLPDEVWLPILSLLPHSLLCVVAQVCGRLRTLTNDPALWKRLKIENSTLTERWMLFWAKCHPRTLSLYSCSGLSVTSSGLEMFFTLCRHYLEEVKVTSCTGPCLHGDQILPMIGRLCDKVTSVDVSWSGATDTGVKALSDGRAGLRLKSIVLNGCHVTNDPLKNLVLGHKESLCRLEVFGCQYLTPSCLKTIYEMCPGLKHLNIGQVPKVNAHSLTVMTSQLKCLLSLNLSGLQAVTDATVTTLLQNCVEVQSLTLSSCPGVTDLTLRNISRYAPCIRSLDVSGCKAVTDVGLQSLTLGCRRLQQLDLSSTGAGNRGVTSLANYCSGHLHTVKLSFCHITPETILKLCRHGKRLKVLHLYGCARLPTEREIREVNTVVRVYPLPSHNWTEAH